MGFLKIGLFFFMVIYNRSHTDWRQLFGPVNMRSLDQTCSWLIIFFVHFNNLFLHDRSDQLYNPVLSGKQHQMLDQSVSGPECLTLWAETNSMLGYSILKRKLIH